MKKYENTDQQHLHLLKKINFTPIFILGLHRSGTSILYKMLAATNQFNVVTAYHIIKYNELLENHLYKKDGQVKVQLAQSFHVHGVNDRGIDRLQITADFAEEYGFLLGQTTPQMYITKKNYPTFIQMAKKIQFINNNEKPLLLKNPYDFPNFLYLKQLFPNAKFIFIHRHPYKTLSSTMKAVRMLLRERHQYTTQLYRLYNQLFDNPLLLTLVRLCFSQLSVFGCILLTMNTCRATHHYLSSIHQLNTTDYISITYEELCAHPQEVMQLILTGLSLPSVSIDFISLIHERKAQLDTSVIQLRRFIYQCMKPYFVYNKYQPEFTNETKPV